MAPYLCECLDSVLDQQYSDFEVCLVDDGSQDESRLICDEYALKDSRIKLKHQANGGVSVARNTALEMANGEFVWFVDADDYIERDCLDYLDAIIHKSQSDTVFFGNKRMLSQSNLSYESCEKHKFLCSHYSYCNPLIIFSRNVIEAFHLRFTPGMKMAEDLEFQYKYLLHCRKPIAIPYDLYYIRERHNSASRNEDSNRNNLQGNKLILANILNYVRPLTDKGCDWLGERMAERTKSFLQSAALIKDIDTKELNQILRDYVISYRSLGFSGFDDLSIRLAFLDVRLYFMAIRVLYQFN